MSGRAARAFPPTGRILDVGGHPVHAHVEGTGPDVILLHGASGNTRDFTYRLVGRLGGRFRVIAFDRPGLGHTPPLHARGESPSEQAALLDRAAAMLGVRRAVIAGHSYGGAVAMAWALDRPQRVAGIVSLAGATMPWPGELGPWYRYGGTDLGAATLVPLVACLMPRPLARRLIPSIFTPQPVPEGYATHLGVDLTLRPATLRANVRQVGSLRPHLVDMARRYSGLAVPVEILHGTADTIVPIEVHGRPMAELLPDARLTELPGVGHMPHHAAPEATDAAIARVAKLATLH